MTHLQVLFCGSNQLTELDLSSVSHLELLDCSHNQISELDLSPVTALDYPNVAPLTRVLSYSYHASDSLTMSMFVFGAERRAQNQIET